MKKKSKVEQEKVVTKKTLLTILTEEEINMIQRFRENKERQEQINKIRRVGFLKRAILKRDLLLDSSVNAAFEIRPGKHQTILLSELQAEVKEFFNIYCFAKGTPFYSRIIDGKEYWSDVNDYLEEDNEWAKKNLQNIQKYEE